jgi:hypothetical protein
MILLSGCGVLDISQSGNFTPEESDEALKFDYEITGRVLPGQVINMKVHLTNQVKDDVSDVKLRITDFYGLKLLNQICPGADRQLTGDNDCGFISDKCGCHFSTIPSFDDEEINLIFRVPDSDEIARIGRELEPEFTITYNYYGETNYLIPIIKFDERSTIAKIEKTQTKGPIHVDIERGFTSSSDEWERNGSQFSIVMRVNDVLNSKSNVEIDRNNFTIVLNKPILDTSGEGLCDFTPSGSDFIPNNNITLPMQTPLVCALEAYNEQVPWTYGTITVDYNYTYKIVKTETIEVETVIA